MDEQFGVTVKQSRWRAKIVTSLLPIPSLLAQVVILKLSRLQKTVREVFIPEIRGETVIPPVFR
jgi:hypothetical protein